MTRRVLVALLIAGQLIAGCGGGDGNEGNADVDVVYLNHGPVQTVLTDIDTVLARYEGRVSVARHDQETPEGKSFAKKHDLVGHVPIAILIDGKVRFRGFPTGRAPIKSAEGSWTIPDLETALRQRAG